MTVPLDDEMHRGPATALSDLTERAEAALRDGEKRVGTAPRVRGKPGRLLVSSAPPKGVGLSPPPDYESDLDQGEPGRREGVGDGIGEGTGGRDNSWENDVSSEEDEYDQGGGVDVSNWGMSDGEGTADSPRSWQGESERTGTESDELLEQDLSETLKLS